MSCQTALFASVLLVSAVGHAGADDIPRDVTKWIAVEPPVPYEGAWLVANSSKHEWAATLRDGRVEVEPWRAPTPPPLPFAIAPGTSREGLAGRRSSIKVADGWLVAFNAGEFGAGLWWFAPDGSSRDRIAEAWIKGFFPTDAGLLAPEGLAHGAGDQGRVLRLARGPDGRWHSEDFVDLKAAPEAALIDGRGRLVVATTERLLRITPATRQVEVLVEGAFWGGLYPNSIVEAPSGTLYLGMRHGVAEVRPADGGSVVRWLLPNRAFAEAKLREGFK
jgi:hypothetical protein